jgi:hypothetical protein
MSTSSLILTVGTALRYAADGDLPVELMVHGEWISGHVVGIDSQGVVLQTGIIQQAVVQLTHISVVRLHVNDAVAQIPQRQGA